MEVVKVASVVADMDDIEYDIFGDFVDRPGCIRNGNKT